MFRNETGVKVYENGDQVTIRTGKVVYTVVGTNARRELVVNSNNTTRAKAVPNEGDLNLVINVRDTDEWKAANEAPAEEPVKETTSYQKAVLFALNKLGKHVYAGTVSATKKAKTRKLNTRQKASRKANR